MLKISRSTHNLSSFFWKSAINCQDPRQSFGKTFLATLLLVTILKPVLKIVYVTILLVVPAYTYSCSRHGYCITYQSSASFINKLYLLSLTACKKSSDSKGILLKEDVKLQNRHSEPLPDTDRNFAGKSEREKISRKHSSQTVCSSPYAKKGP